jgi:SAM-dependent methyltransferase
MALDFKFFESVLYRYINKHFSLELLNSIENQNMYLDWLSDFQYSHGMLDTQRKIDIKKISTTFDINIKSHDDLFKFIYSLDNFYVLTLTLASSRCLDKNFSYLHTKQYLSFSYFRNIHIHNYHPVKNLFFGENDKNINAIISDIALLLQESPLSTFNTFDFIREIFHKIYPREIRHSLGEFYTPDWLAEYLVNKNIKNIDSGISLDPTCGSGTFLIALGKKLKKIGEKNILNSVIGFDINPITAFAAKTNLILNNIEEVKQSSEITIPVFSSNILDMKKQEEMCNTFDIKTIKQVFEKIASLCKSSNGKYSDKEITELNAYEYVLPYLLKNVVDRILGNPPWVNWEYLPNTYKRDFLSMWQYYGIFDYKGTNAIFIKEDISSLITYLSIDHFLKDSGKISFIVKESLFKSIKQAAGFRKFYLKNCDIPFKILAVEDLTFFKPFNGVANRTFIFHAEKGKKTTYPVDYITWVATGRKKFKDTDSCDFVIKNFTFENKLAIPICVTDLTSGWASISPELYKKMHVYTGTSYYRARTGVFTGGANGIYWINIKERISENIVLIENITERAKIKFNKVSVPVETDLLYPYLSGSELSQWSFTYKKYIICPHDEQTKMYPFDENILKNGYPKTYDFFNMFKKGLQLRKGFTSFDRKIHEKYFYTLQRIGSYTFSKYKVGWKYIASNFTCAVIEDVDDEYIGKTTVIPNEKIIYIGLDVKEEAYYLCGLLSSSIFRELIDSFKVSTQIAPSIIKNLNIPKFNPKDENHVEISLLCEKGHNDIKNASQYLDKIDCLIDSVVKPNKTLHM